MKKSLLKLINSFLALFLVYTFLMPATDIFTVHADDLLETAFQESIANENIIMLGNNKQAVGNEVFREGQEFGSDWSLNTRPPLLVRIAKLLLRFTIAIAITMVIYNGVMYIAEIIKGSDKATNATKNLIYVGAGLLLSLMSVAIINLISSVSISSLKDVAEYIEDSFRDKFVEFCSWAGENTTQAANLDGWNQAKIQSYCANPSQPIARTQDQINSFVLWVVQNPGDRTEEQFLQFLEWLESQFGFVPELPSTTTTPQEEQQTDSTYGTYRDLRVTTVTADTQTLQVTFRNDGSKAVQINAQNSFSIECRNETTGELFNAFIPPSTAINEIINPNSSKTILGIPFGGANGAQIDCEIL